MIRNLLPILVILMASVANADDPSTIDQDGMKERSPPAPPVVLNHDQDLEIETSFSSSPMIVRFTSADTHYGNVEFHNEMAPAGETPIQVTFSTDVGPIIVHFVFGDGSAPDLFYVVPPPGYYAYPVEVSVEEGEIGVIEIHEGGLG